MQQSKWTHWVSKWIVGISIQHQHQATTHVFAIVDLIENFPQGLDLGLRENRDIWGIWSAELKSKRVG